VRFLKVDAENALELTNQKFMKRFTMMEQQVEKNGKHLNEMTLEEMDAVWNEIKKQNIEI
jgi:XTP/dITP diphosphohydrolase